MFLHEMDNARIEWCNTITNPKLAEDDTLMKFNIVVANPPFSLDKWGAEGAAAELAGRTILAENPGSEDEGAAAIEWPFKLVLDRGTGAAFGGVVCGAVSWRVVAGCCSTTVASGCSVGV